MATIEMLGQGPIGTVHAEWDPLLGKSVAVKELDSAFAGNETFSHAFLHRAERLFDLDHEHVLAVYRVSGREAPAVVRELAEGTFAEFSGPLPPAEVEVMLRQALLGLQAMHERGIVHGAVKPQNLFRCGTRVKIGDFGVPGAPLVPTDSVHRYQAPEQRHGAPASPGADLYSLGLVACELLLGASRFDELMQGDPRRIAGLPAALSVALHRLLESVEADRAADAGGILALLDGASPIGIGFIAPPSLDTSALDARLRPAKPKPVVDVQKVKRAGAITFGALFALFAVVAVLYLRAERPDERHASQPLASTTKVAAAAAPVTGTTAPQSTEPAAAVPQATQAPAPSRPESGPPRAVPATPPPNRPPSAVTPAVSTVPNAPEPRPQAPTPQKTRMKPPEPGPVKLPLAVTEAPKLTAELSPAAASEPAAEPSRHATTDSAPALPSDIEKVFVTLERQSKRAQEAYADEEKPNEELGARMEEFYDAATGLRKTWRRANGKGFGAFANKLLRISSQEANPHALEVQARELIRRGSQIDNLLERIPMGPAAMGYWKEVRRNLKLLEGSFR